MAAAKEIGVDAALPELDGIFTLKVEQKTTLKTLRGENARFLMNGSG